MKKVFVFAIVVTMLCLLALPAFPCEIHLKPSSYPPSINLKNNGLTPLLIIGEAHEVVIYDKNVKLISSSIEFGYYDAGGNIIWVPITPDKSSLEYYSDSKIPDDGIIDLILKFKTQDLRVVLQHYGIGSHEVPIKFKYVDPTEDPNIEKEMNGVKFVANIVNI